MAQRVQPGGRVNEEVYERFREFVKQQHGGVRGNLGRELEQAMCNRMDVANGKDSMTRIENDVATIKAMLANGEADGGSLAPTPSEGEYARARGLRKPAANQPRSDKITYLVNRYLERDNCDKDGGALIKKQVENIVRDEYSFEDEILAEYIEAVYKEIKNRFDTEPHPLHGQFLVWGRELEQALQDAKAETEKEMEEIE